MMRITTLISLLGVAVVAAVGCVRDVDQPALAGPSTFGQSIVMIAERNTLTQNGVDFTDIKITALGPDGQSLNIPLRAQVFVSGVAADYGTLSTKNPITPTTIRYTAPAASTLVGGQVAQTVTIAVTPVNAGDFFSEVQRQVQIQLQPQGIIQPVNPNLIANFTVNPAAPKVMDVVTFDASTSTLNGTSCGVSCSYVWNFGDGTTGTGQVTSHQYRSVGTYQTTLTVSDFLGASSVKVQAVSVAQGTPPGAAFTVSPENPGVNQDVFFDATSSRPSGVRKITNYDWSFGDGSFATGPIVVYRYTAGGTYKVTLVTTDDAGTKSNPTTQDVTVGSGDLGPEPTAVFTCLQGDASEGKPVACNASASKPGDRSSIVSYTFNWGDGSGDEVQTNPVQSHLYIAAGTFNVTLTVRDSAGRTATTQQTVTVVP